MKYGDEDASLDVLVKPLTSLACVVYTLDLL